MSLQIIDLLATDKSQYFAQPRPISNNSFFKQLGPGGVFHIKRTGVLCAFSWLKTGVQVCFLKCTCVWDQCQEFVARLCPRHKSLKHTHEK